MTVDLTYTDTEDALRDSVRSLLSTHCPSDRVTAMYDGDETLIAELWGTVSASIELPGLGIAEAQGGGGASGRELAVVMEELGRVVAPGPFLTSSVIAATVLAACGADEAVISLVDGSKVAILAVPWTAIDASGFALPEVSSHGRVDGVIGAVAEANLATAIIVAATRDGVLTLQLVEADSVAVTRRNSLDMTRPVCEVRFHGASATELARGQAAADAVQEGLRRGAAMLASEQLGLAEWCLQTTVAYTQQRHQFGRPIGSFQAIKHRLARLWISVSSARAAARNAASLIDDGGTDAVTAVSLAQVFCSEAAVLAAEECVQLHGGIGMTWEHPAHLYLKRAKADQVALGSPAHYRSGLAQLHRL